MHTQDANSGYLTANMHQNMQDMLNAHKSQNDSSINWQLTMQHH